MFFNTFSTILPSSNTSGVWEFWDGGAWVPMSVMAADTGLPHATRSNSIWSVTTEESVRFGPMLNWTPTTVGLTTAYWVRFRITSGPLITAPLINRVRLLSDCTRFGLDGFEEFFGDALKTRSIPFTTGAVVAQNLQSPSQQTILFSPNNSLNYPLAQFSASAYNAAGGTIKIPPGLDTSKPLRVTVYYINTLAGGSIFILGLRSSQHRLNSPMTGIAPETIGSFNLSGGFFSNRLRSATFEIDPSTLAPGDLIAFHVFRDGASPLDTYAGTIALMDIEFTGTFWY
jgi:hypothetical protein